LTIAPPKASLPAGNVAPAREAAGAQEICR
jgi:hypothetical protein